jgi:hypothetical protein
VLEDHDPYAEHTLVALGATPPRCVELLDMWRSRPGSELLREMLLCEGTLSPDELAHRTARHEAEMKSALRMVQCKPAHFWKEPDPAAMAALVKRQAVERLEREGRMWAETLIEILPLGLRRALALSAIVNAVRHWHDDAFRHEHVRPIESALTAVAAPIFELTADRWKRNLQPYRGLDTKIRLLAPGEHPACTVWADRSIVHIALSLPLSWFTDIWGRGIALVDDCFVIGLTGSSPDGMEHRVTAVRLERENWKTEPALEAPALVTRDAGRWRLRWV